MYLSEHFVYHKCPKRSDRFSLSANEHFNSTLIVVNTNTKHYTVDAQRPAITYGDFDCIVQFRIVDVQVAFLRLLIFFPQ